MAGPSDKKMLQHGRPLTKVEVEAFAIIHKQVDNLVLIPVVVNGQARFGLARVSKSDDGLSVQVIALMVTPMDKVCLTTGEEVPIVVVDGEGDSSGGMKYLN